MAIHRTVFHAQWDPSTLPLKNPDPPWLQKTKTIFAQVITLGLSKWFGNIAKQIILPSAFRSWFEIAFTKRNFESFWYGKIEPHNEKLRAHFKAEPHLVVTPDGAKLDATFFRHKDAKPETQTVIYFQPNGCLAKEEVQKWLLKEAVDRGVPCNFAIFDYRSVADSKGEFKSTNDLRLDGASMVQWVREQIGTPPDQIHFYGYSLGGAFSIKTKALYSDQLTGRIVNERSLSSSDQMIQSFLPPSLKCIRGILSWILNKVGYTIDVGGDFQKLKGKKLVIYHPDDPVIRYSASLHRYTQGEGHHTHELCYNPVSGNFPNHHCEPLHSYFGAREEISRFLFNR